MIIPMKNKCRCSSEIEHDNKQKERNQNSKKKSSKKIFYISQIDRIPEIVMEAIYASMYSARHDHLLGMYSYFFTAITRGDLKTRYIIKSPVIGEPKQATTFYIQKHIINPIYNSVKTACSNMNVISIISDSEECRIAPRAGHKSDE